MTPPESPESTAGCNPPAHSAHSCRGGARVQSWQPAQQGPLSACTPRPDEPPWPRIPKELHPSPAWLPHPDVQPRPSRAGACAVCAPPWRGAPRKQRHAAATAAALRAAGRRRCSRPAASCWPGSERRGGCPGRTRPHRLPSSCAGRAPGGKTSISASSTRAWGAGAGPGQACRADS